MVENTMEDPKRRRARALRNRPWTLSSAAIARAHLPVRRMMMAAAAAKAVARERARRWGLRRGRSLRCRRGDGDGQGKGGQGARKPKAGRLERAGSWRKKGETQAA